MAASSGDREKDPTVSSKPPPKSDNPFIKFRDFADAQISALLQGVIGLPSALSRAPQEQARWAVFDDDLRRRDELQARQRELKESEARRLGQNTEDQECKEGEISGRKPWDWDPSRPGTGKSTSSNNDPSDKEVEIRVKKSWERDSPRAFTKKETIPTNREIPDDLTMDLPLYSPVFKSLFAHLNIPGANDGEADWKQLDGALARGSFLWSQFPSKTRPDQIPQSVMGITQRMVYDHLSRYPDLRSEYSLLPYLMFSRYSPLRLSAGKSPSLSPGEQDSTPDAFPYCEAFEDLMRSTQEQEPLPQFGRYPIHSIRSGKPALLAAENIFWLYHLRRSNVLQEREIREHPYLSDLDLVAFPWASGHLIQLLQRLNEQRLNETSKKEETEQDMYDRFLRWASSPQTAAKELESLFKDWKPKPTEQDTERSLPEAPRSLHDLLDIVSSKGLRGWTELVEEFEKPFRVGPGQEPSNAKEAPTKVQDRDQVVSTTTTTEITKHEDGSEETSVVVWKRFADGHETTTSTTHFEEPASSCQADDGSSARPEQTNDEPIEKNGKDGNAQGEKKGWFWN